MTLHLSTEMTLYEALAKIIALYPNRKAITFGAETITFAQLGERIDRMARQLRKLGVGPGDKVALLLPSSLDYAVAFFAPSALGAVIVPMNPAYRKKEIGHILSDSEASVIIADPRPMGNDVQGILQELAPSLPKLKHIVLRGAKAHGMLCLEELEADSDPLPKHPVEPQGLAALVYTSGTTGVPKAVMHSHASMLAAVATGEKQFNLPPLTLASYLVQLLLRYGRRYLRTSLDALNVLSVTPLHALLGYGVLLYGLLYGHHLVILDRFQPARVIETIDRYKIQAMGITPTMLAAILDSSEFSPRKVTSMLMLFVGAAPTPPELVHRARKAFGCPVTIGFGTTEVGGITLMTLPFDTPALQAETVGTRIEGMEARVVDESRQELPRGQIGELAMRLSSNMLGYYNAPELTAQSLSADGWYYTGDLATMDAKGYIRIMGRKKDMIIRGGQNIFPAEIENHLLSKPGIENVSVVGVPDPIAGERVWAFVLPKPGSELTPAQIIGYCRNELAPYKVPDQVRIVESLPLTSTGKVQKYVLQQNALEELRQSLPRELGKAAE